MKKSPPIKPCPFCGHPAEEITALVFRPNRWIRCTVCGTGTKYCERASTARRIWNKRTPSTPS